MFFLCLLGVGMGATGLFDFGMKCLKIIMLIKGRSNELLEEDRVVSLYFLHGKLFVYILKY